jgi:PTS system glucose-specific IIA component
MFEFLRKKAAEAARVELPKEREIIAPIDGKAVDITEVPDEVFSQKMVGDGMAILPIGDTFRAPIGGKVTKIFETNHAYSIEDAHGMTVMVHIGLDTVELGGEGFERLVQEGDEVKAGDPVIRIDYATVSQKAKDMLTPVIVTSESTVTTIDKWPRVVKSGDTLMKVK